MRSQISHINRSWGYDRSRRGQKGHVKRSWGYDRSLRGQIGHIGYRKWQGQRVTQKSHKVKTDHREVSYRLSEATRSEGHGKKVRRSRKKVTRSRQIMIRNLSRQALTIPCDISRYQCHELSRFNGGECCMEVRASGGDGPLGPIRRMMAFILVDT